MAGIKINFAEVESSFEPLPEGVYDVIIEHVEVRESKSSDNDYLNWELTVQDEEFAGRKLWTITSLGEKALWKLKDTFLALGVIEEDDELDVEWEDDVDITPKEGPRVTSPELEGLAAVAVVYNEMYEGKEQNRIRELRDPNEATEPVKAGASAKSSSGSRSSNNKSSRGRKLR